MPPWTGIYPSWALLVSADLILFILSELARATADMILSELGLVTADLSL